MALANARDKESRRSPRRVFNHAIGLLVGGSYDLAQALQISEGGLALVSARPLNLESRVVVTLKLPGAAGLVLRAQVVNERSKIGKMFGYGLQFSGLDLHQRRMIRSYVSAKTQAEAEAEDEDER